MNDNILSKVKEIVQNILETEETITDDAHLVDDLGIDSVIILQLIANLEMEFDISFDDEDLLVDKFETVSSLADYMKDLLENR